ncbi:hypothetical protein CAPTEDRAFT_128223 [Capitella teleta]|uniref:HTH La-type RNA-binding domain-containing protein n=1 Tax=Capitella teleta TaxID=283909 RepID=R7VGP0_CAPTE|nr:hypothetical protein CAPTEDRAFT_128223 [Capitella teleta]|eukprot:ELU14860.1 hypothetical protein CAPTEDRAFT_128223 [Capitella teleta]
MKFYDSASQRNPVRLKDERTVENSALQKKIVKQIEVWFLCLIIGFILTSYFLQYYFGNFNLLQDEFLINKMDSENWVELSVLTTFKKLQKLSSDFKVIVEAVEKSCSQLIECHEDGQKIRRNPRIPWRRDHTLWKRDLRERSLVMVSGEE